MNKNSLLLTPEFSKFIRLVSEDRELTPQTFSLAFTKFQKDNLSRVTRDEFLLRAGEMAEDFVKSDKIDFAGIVYSTLCKITEYMPKQLEYFAQRGYEVAKSKGDVLHMMARLNNLRKVYYNRPDKVYEYVQVLYKQEKCLKEITNHYDRLQGSYSFVQRKPASVDSYEKMLAFIQTEIAKLTRRKHPLDALNKLYSAKAIFQKQHDLTHLSYINMLIDKINYHLQQFV